MEIKQFFIKEFFFRQGKWEGKLEFTILLNDQAFIGTAPFTFYKSWNIYGLTYPLSVTDEQRKLIRKEVLHLSKPFLEQIEKQFIQPREQLSFKPTIEKFKMIKERSFSEHLVVQFKLIESSVTFSAYIFLEENEWHCDIQPEATHQLDDYKRYLLWEDDIFDVLVEKLKKIHEYRLKFVVHTLKYKQK